eukprot:scaffold14195_cov48-Attheya_sp.AAC.1
MPKSNKKEPSTTTRSKSQALDIKALQALIAATELANNAETTTNVAELKATSSDASTDKKLTKVISKIDTNQDIQDDCHKIPTRSIANLQTMIESKLVTSNVPNNLRNDIDNLGDKICSAHFDHEQEVLHNDDLQANLDMFKQAKSAHPTCAYQEMHPLSRAFPLPMEESVAQ